MVSWRESRLILIFIVLMMILVGVAGVAQTNTFGVAASLLSPAALPIVSPSILPVPIPATLKSQPMQNNAFPVEVIPKNPVNPFK